MRATIAFLALSAILKNRIDDSIRYTTLRKIDERSSVGFWRS